MPTRQGASRTVRGGNPNDPLFVKLPEGSSTTGGLTDAELRAAPVEVVLNESGLSVVTTRAQQIVLTAGEPLNAYKVITTNEGGDAVYADAGTLDHAGRVVGISANAANTGDTVNVQFAGEITNAGWSWTPGQLLFVGLEGDITSDQVGVFSQAVGHAKTSTVVVVRVGRPILRS